MSTVSTLTLVGLAGAFAATHVLVSVLAGVSSTDPLRSLGVVVVPTLAGTAGCAIPARRAMAVDPVICVRCE